MAGSATEKGMEQAAEHRWPALIAIAIAVVVYAFLPPNIEIVPRWVVPGIAALLLIPLTILNPTRFTRETTWSRWLSIGLAFGLAIVNQVEVLRIVIQLAEGSTDAAFVLLTALQVWVTDVIAFALIYWELDRSGPFARRMGSRPQPPDFRFPQEEDGTTSWRPAFFDYAYFSLSNQMAFSPTDVMPLTMRAKALMGFQAFSGFVLLALVIARAVNIVGSG
jgi:uncharacterized membrane protein